MSPPGTFGTERFVTAAQLSILPGGAMAPPYMAAGSPLPVLIKNRRAEACLRRALSELSGWIETLRDRYCPAGWCSAQRIQNIYDCQWQSYNNLS